ncbi:MAG: AMP-binding protein [Pseudomonadota bacterium]
MTTPTFSFTGASQRRIPIGDLIHHHAAIDPNATAITTAEGRIVTRGEFVARCNRRAHWLAQHGVVADDLVTIMLPKGLEFYETAFAIWKLGATPNPVSSSLADAELTAILEVGKPRLVIGADTSRAQSFATLPSQTEVSCDFSADNFASIVPKYWKAMTSGGSTGRPKLIIDHMPGAWDPAEGGLTQQPGETVLNPGPLHHNGPFLGTMLGLFAGGRVVEMSAFDPLRVLQLVSEHRITWTLLVPTMMHRIARLTQAERSTYDISSLRLVLHTAAPCPPWLKRFWIEWLGPERIFEVYTGTERQANVTITGQEWLTHPGSVGKLQPGAALRILDQDGVDVLPGETGEIYFLPDGGRNSTYHYLGAEARARGDWESLGDLGRRDEEGYLYLSDRRLDLIIRGGVNIYPAEIEAALDAHPAISSSVAIGVPDADLGEAVHAIVQVAPGAMPAEAALREFLAARLSHHKIPRSFEFVETPLRDEAGKVRRSAWRASTIAALPETSRVS